MRLLACLFLTSAIASQAAAIPTEITSEYQVTNMGVTIGRVSESFVRKGDDYTIQSVTRSEGPLKIFLDDQVTLESTGKVLPGGLRPMHFGQRRARDSRRDVEARFDWERGVMHSTFQGEASEVPLPKETQDRISLMYQLMRANQRDSPLRIPMSNGRKVEIYTYRFVDEVRLSTPAGEFDTLHFESLSTDPKARKAEVWLARDHHNFPVRVVFDDPRGLRLEQALVSLKAR